MTTTLYAITFDCHDAEEQAKFWAKVFNRAVDEGASSDFASIGLGDDATTRPHWMFMKVPEGKSSKNRVHLDIATTDLEAEVERILALGASRIADRSEGGLRWSTLADPEGNEFDVAIADE
jgi:predicted enzyme related to lactoylglutathione lyase